MSTSVLIVIVIVVLVLVGGLMMIRRMGRSRLRALPAESRARYATAWHAIEARFIDQPAEAVQEADRLAQEMLRERGARFEEGKLPKRLTRARAVTEMREGEAGTEGMRQAMLHYRAEIEDGIGRDEIRPETGRREVAS
jgi:hypothetical protein